MLRETPLSLRSYISITLLLILFSSCSVPAPSGLVQLRPFQIESKENQRTEFDGLILLGAFELRSRHPQFGGISGLSIGADGRLYAVSDRGYWLSARMRHDSEGALSRPARLANQTHLNPGKNSHRWTADGLRKRSPARRTGRSSSALNRPIACGAICRRR